jgi:hypothetical protein
MDIIGCVKGDFVSGIVEQWPTYLLVALLSCAELTQHAKWLGTGIATIVRCLAGSDIPILVWAWLANSELRLFFLETAWAARAEAIWCFCAYAVGAALALMLIIAATSLLTLPGATARTSAS